MFCIIYPWVQVINCVKFGVFMPSASEKSYFTHICKSTKRNLVMYRSNNLKNEHFWLMFRDIVETKSLMGGNASY